MSTRDFLHRKAIRSSLKSDWDTYKLYRNKVTLMIRNSKEYYFNNTVQQGIGNSGKMWKALNDILPSKSSSTPSSIVVNGNVLSGNEDIANGFNDHFSSVADVLIKDNFVASSTSNVNRVDHSNVTPNVSNPKLNLPCISHEFVNSEILRMSTKKATGLDDINCKILKLARPVIVDSLTFIMNLSLSTGVFPNDWKIAKVVPLYKGGDLKSTNNYRPISILSCVSKIIEKVVHKQLYSFLSEYNLINQHQSGFRPFHSTETSLTDMIDTWLNNMNSGKMTGVAFVDLRKAFDTVNHEILLNKLYEIGATDITVKWFRSYLTKRTQKGIFQRVFIKCTSC